jgi:hypothetical protein
VATGLRAQDVSIWQFDGEVSVHSYEQVSFIAEVSELKDFLFKAQLGLH